MKHIYITIYSRVINSTDLDNSSSESLEVGLFELEEVQADAIKNPGVTPILDTFNQDLLNRLVYSMFDAGEIVNHYCYYQYLIPRLSCDAIVLLLHFPRHS